MRPNWRLATSTSSRWRAGLLRVAQLRRCLEVWRQFGKDRWRVILAVDVLCEARVEHDVVRVDEADRGAPGLCRRRGSAQPASKLGRDIVVGAETLPGRAMGVGAGVGVESVWLQVGVGWRAAVTIFREVPLAKPVRCVPKVAQIVAPGREVGMQIARLGNDTEMLMRVEPRQHAGTRRCACRGRRKVVREVHGARAQPRHVGEQRVQLALVGKPLRRTHLVDHHHKNVGATRGWGYASGVEWSPSPRRPECRHCRHATR